MSLILALIELSRNIGIINCLDIITPSFPLCDSGACKPLIRDLGGSDPKIDPGESKLSIQEERGSIPEKKLSNFSKYMEILKLMLKINLCWLFTHVLFGQM